jgi:prepilin-type N-terminal cleavage/methylation domain-containing protein
MNDCRSTSPGCESRDARGFSLIEVMIAIALTGVVVLSVLSLFAIGRSNVYAGRQMTHAISVGTRIMEDLSTVPLQELFDAFNITGTTTLAEITVPPAGIPDSTYPDSILRGTTAVASAGDCTTATLPTFTNDSKLFLQRWYCQMQNVSNKLPKGQIFVVISPRKRADTTQPLSATNASVVHVRTIVRWSEGLRPRQVVFDTTKFNRPNPD